MLTEVKGKLTKLSYHLFYIPCFKCVSSMQHRLDFSTVLRNSLTSNWSILCSMSNNVLFVSTF